MIERAQQPDGYLGIYFVVVDPAGRFKNLRDMHEMCELGLCHSCLCLTSRQTTPVTYWRERSPTTIIQSLVNSWT